MVQQPLHYGRAQALADAGERAVARRSLCFVDTHKEMHHAF
jgi:hypothetical protein